MLPTRVGMNRMSIYFPNNRVNAPHAGGDEPNGRISARSRDICSPRGWG